MGHFRRKMQERQKQEEGKKKRKLPVASQRVISRKDWRKIQLKEL